MIGNGVEDTAYRGGLNANGTNAEDGEVALKMTNQMPVAIELNKKNRIAMVTESLTGWISEDEITQGFNISMAYSDKQEVQIKKNGKTKELEKYWLDIRQDSQNNIYESEEEIYNNIGLSLVEEGPINTNTYIFTGLAPYIQQFPSGETVISYNKYYQKEDGSWGAYPTLRIGDTEANFENANEFRYDKEEGFGFASISVLSSHRLGLTTATTYVEDGEEKHYIGIYPMQLNHTIDANWHSDVDFANNEITWNKNTDALFVGSESQAQITIQTAYDKNNIYFLINRLDNSLTDEDTVELYVNTNTENNNSSKILLDKNGVREFNEDTNIENYGIQSSAYVNDTNNEEGGYKVLVAIPKEILGEVNESININAVLSNKDEGSEEIITDTFTNIDMNNTTTWNKVNLVKEKIEIYALPIKTEYIQNYDKLDLTGAKLKIQYNENEYEIIDITPEMVTGFDNSKLGTQALTVTYRGLTAKFNIVINEKQLSNISIKALPTKLEYTQNYEELDVTGGKIELQYNDTSKETIDMTEGMITGFDNTKLGKQTLTVTYEGKTTTYEVNIVEKQITSIKLKTEPTKLEYTQNYDLLDVTGGKIEISYNDGSKQEIDLTKEMVIGFDNSELGRKTLTITYGGKTTTYEITVIERTIIDVKIKNMPTKLEYIQNYEELDITRGSLEITYNNGTTEEIAIKEEMVEGFDNSKLGKQTLTIKYGEYTNTFEINIVAKSIEKIEISKVPSKVEYIQNEEKLNLEGGKIVITYNDKTTEEKDITEEMVTGFDNRTPGTIQLTVSYEGLIDTFNVTITTKAENNNSETNTDITGGQDQTITDKVLPAAGLRNIMLIIITILVIISIYMFYKMKKYKDVK